MDYTFLSSKKKLPQEKILSIFGEPDYAISDEKRNGFIYNMARIGAGFGLISVLLGKGVTFKEVVSSQKKYIVLQVAKGLALGGVTGAVYVASVGQIARLRGKKDGPINHFTAAFAGVAPYTLVYKPSFKYFFISGILWGLFLMVCKSAAYSELFDEVFEERRRRAIVTRYPELYLYQQTKRDAEDGKFS